MAFASGFCIMTVEMLGARILSPYFGGSLSVWGSIITVFMLALALGYLWGGKLSARKPSAITFAGFFIGAAVFFIPIIVFSDVIMELIFMAYPLTQVNLPLQKPRLPLSFKNICQRHKAM
mgnify:CR=1 FL=1